MGECSRAVLPSVCSKGAVCHSPLPALPVSSSGCAAFVFSCAYIMEIAHQVMQSLSGGKIPILMKYEGFIICIPLALPRSCILFPLRRRIRKLFPGVIGWLRVLPEVQVGWFGTGCSSELDVCLLTLELLITHAFWLAVAWPY